MRGSSSIQCLILIFGMVIPSGLFAETQEFSIQDSRIKVVYALPSRTATLQLFRDEALIDTKSFSLHRTPHAKVRNLAYLFERSLYLVELHGTPSKVLSVPIIPPSGLPSGFGELKTGDIPQYGDRGDLELFGDLLILTLGYPGSVNLIHKDRLELVAKRMINDWPTRVVVCENQVYFGPLFLLARPSLLGRIEVKNTQELVERVLGQGILFERVLLPGNGQYLDMKLASPESLKVTLQKGRGIETAEIPCH